MTAKNLVLGPLPLPMIESENVGQEMSVQT